MTDDLSALVGTWETEATHPAYPGVVVPGRTTFEWLPGEQFLIQRTSTSHPDFPDSIAVIGAPDGELTMFYFDSRGVHRVYRMAMNGSELTIWRDHPGFSQRFAGTLDGDTLSGVWQLSRDGSTWDDDLAGTWRKHA
jgi:hypothetical protein